MFLQNLGFKVSKSICGLVPNYELPHVQSIFGHNQGAINLIKNEICHLVVFVLAPGYERAAVIC